MEVTILKGFLRQTKAGALLDLECNKRCFLGVNQLESAEFRLVTVSIASLAVKMCEGSSSGVCRARWIDR